METVLSADGLTKTYGTCKALDGQSIELGRGQVIGILGPNGAGKTTMIECMLGTKKADSGKTTILGLDPVKDRKKLFEKVGVQFQEASYPNKIRTDELCETTAALYRKPADYRVLLKQFSLEDKKKAEVSSLSGGERQKLFIVLALIPDPQIVFLDELTTGLDPRARKNVWGFLKELKQRGLTIVMTSHFMDEVEELCDQILILREGRRVFQGTVKEAVSSSPFDDFEEAYLWYTEEEEES